MQRTGRGTRAEDPAEALGKWESIYHVQRIGRGQCSTVSEREKVRGKIEGLVSPIRQTLMARLGN